MKNGKRLNITTLLYCPSTRIRIFITLLCLCLLLLFFLPIICFFVLISFCQSNRTEICFPLMKERYEHDDGKYHNKTNNRSFQ